MNLPQKPLSPEQLASARKIYKKLPETERIMLRMKIARKNNDDIKIKSLQEKLNRQEKGFAFTSVFKMLPKTEQLIIRAQIAWINGETEKAGVLEEKIAKSRLYDEAERRLFRDGKCPSDSIGLPADEIRKIAEKVLENLLIPTDSVLAMKIAANFGFLEKIREPIKSQAQSYISQGKTPVFVLNLLKEHGMGEKDYAEALIKAVMHERREIKHPKCAAMIAANYSKLINLNWLPAALAILEEWEQRRAKQKE